MTAARLVPAALAACLLGGCVMVPYPVREGAPTAKIVDARAIEFIQPGRTTREEVLLRLGAPFIASKSEDRFVYSVSYPTYKMVMLLLGLDGTVAMFERAQHRRLLVEIHFDGTRVREIRHESESVLRPESRRF